jgi:hypothetical protein
VANVQPNFKKIAPISSSIQQNKEQDTHSKIESLWVHTRLPNGQAMPQSFFEDLEPFCSDLNLKADSRGYSEPPGKAITNNLLTSFPIFDLGDTRPEEEKNRTLQYTDPLLPLPISIVSKSFRREPFKCASAYRAEKLNLFLMVGATGLESQLSHSY